jgi:hypothetical protein
MSTCRCPSRIANQACHQGPEGRAGGANGQEEAGLEQIEPLEVKVMALVVVAGRTDVAAKLTTSDNRRARSVLQTTHRTYSAASAAERSSARVSGVPIPDSYLRPEGSPISLPVPTSGF